MLCFLREWAERTRPLAEKLAPGAVADLIATPDAATHAETLDGVRAPRSSVRWKILNG